MHPCSMHARSYLVHWIRRTTPHHQSHVFKNFIRFQSNVCAECADAGARVVNLTPAYLLEYNWQNGSTRKISRAEFSRVFETHLGQRYTHSKHSKHSKHPKPVAKLLIKMEIITLFLIALKFCALRAQQDVTTHATPRLCYFIRRFSRQISSFPSFSVSNGHGIQFGIAKTTTKKKKKYKLELKN